MGHEQHTVAVFAPVLGLSITIESGPDERDDEIHFHPAGQGFWIARMLRHLGQRPLLCGPIGGESGTVISGLLPRWGIDVSPVRSESASPTTLQDRRSGDREIVSETAHLRLDRHTLDEMYGQFFDHALSAGLAVIVGQVGETVPTKTYRRLGHDLASTAVKVVADMHGPELESLLEGGGIDVLKISDENLKEDGLMLGDEDEEAWACVGSLVDRGAAAVVLSRAGRPALASIGGARFVATPPALEAADFRGAGDSMTAGLAAAIATGLGPEDMLRLGCAAGAANVTRHGLGSTADRLVVSLIELVQVSREDPTPRGALV